MDSLLFALFVVAETVVRLYMYVIVGSVILSWLVQFNVVNTSNRFVYVLGNVLYRLTQPVLRRIRNVVPDVGGLDFSPVILILALYFVRLTLADMIFDMRFR